MKIYINDNEKYLSPKQSVKKLRKKYKKTAKREEQSSIKNLVDKIAKELALLDIYKWKEEQVELLNILVQYETNILKKD